MRVFVSWAEVSTAKEAERSRLEELEKAKASEDKQFANTLSPTSSDSGYQKYRQAKEQQALCLPEYQKYLESIELQKGAFAHLDPLNRNILAIRFLVPNLQKAVTYQLARRVPGENNLAVTLAARSFLLNTFPGEWSGNTHATKSGVMFVGMQGLKNFMQRFAYACGALGQPLPSNLWLDSPQLELTDAISARELMESCAFTEPIEENKRRYTGLIQGWMGIGASADRDMSLLTATSYKLGF